MSTYRELYNEGRNRLLAAGIANAQGDARALLLYASGMSLNKLLLSYEDEADAQDPADTDKSPGMAGRYLDMIDRRCAHVPLQYITHVQNFCGYDMYVDENVLIPRQDTEVLVEKVLDTCGRRECFAEYGNGTSSGEAAGYDQSNDGDAGKSLLDLCTGSGCIAIALKLLGDFDKVYASDISTGALDVARRNAENNGAEIAFIESDMFEKIDDTAIADARSDIRYQGAAASDKKPRFDVIVSNPPYIPDAQVDELDEEVRGHEPRTALAGDADGMYYYRKIAQQAGGYMKDGGRLFLEIGYDQGEAVSELLEGSKAGKGHFEEIEITKDLAGLDRVVSAIWRRTDA